MTQRVSPFWRFRALCALVLTGLSLHAAPQLQQGAVVNAASFALDSGPNSGIARGSLFTVFGVGVGPQETVRADSFPLPLDLGGVSIRITSGGNDYAAVVLFAVNSQVSAILPSAVPAGTATLVLTYNGEASNAITFQVVDRQTGIFSRTQNGNGLAVIQNYISPSNQPVNTLNQSAQPGQVAILWGTGLGAALNGDDRNAPAPGNVVPPEQFKIYVGGKEAIVEYAGRSGCCAGVDQINFRVPADLDGCFVPVVAIINGVPSNFTSMSVTPNGNVCNDPLGLNSQLLQSLLSKPAIRVGSILLARNLSEFSSPLGSFKSVSDVGVASFSEFTTSGLLESPGIVGSPIFVPGSCMVSTFRNEGDEVEVPEFDEVFRVRALDAGSAINLLGPKGARSLPKDNQAAGEYFAQLSGSNPLAPVSYLDPGFYSMSNGAGGVDVKGFNLATNVPEFVTWTNKAAISNVARNQPLTVTWNQNQPLMPTSNLGGAGAVTSILGMSFSLPKRIASVFFCYADAASGSFTVPAYVLSAMIRSEGSTGGIPVPTGLLSVGGFAVPALFTASGLDVGVFATSSSDGKTVSYR